MHILAPYISCVCNTSELQEAIDGGYKEIYIMTLKGTYKHHILRGENRYVRIKVDKIPGYTEPAIEEGMNFLPAGKIPYSIYEQVLAFFKKVMEVKVSEVEAMIHVLYNAELGYHLGVPPQTVSKASASYDWNYIPAGTSVIIDIHSHNTMGAFFSGTDDRDDRGNISFSGVFGKLKDREPMTIWRFNYFDKKFVATAEDLFEVPARPAVDIPQEWIDKVSTPSYTTSYKGGYSGPGNVGRPVHGPVERPVVGRNHDQIAKWGYPTTTQTPLRDGPGGNQNHPSQSDPRATIGRTFEDTDAGDSLLHFFGEELNDNYPVRVTARGNVIPTVSGLRDDEYVFDEPVTVYDAQTGTMKTIERPEPVDPNFGVTSAREDFNQDDGEADPVGKSSGELALMEEASISTEAEFADPEYEIIANIHGVDVADAWHSIQTEMSQLDGQDELNQELICDMAGLTSEDGQMKIMKALFERLSTKNREKIETFGL